ncbi:aminopeptidase [Pseudenterobacter timonensis]|uniref:Aminopeptidase n=1 Tax=Pseudenterobacter timonensis TaxID=1755099 RepID=A0ABV4A6Y8_9ENTR
MELLTRLRDWLKRERLDGVLISSRQNKLPHLGISTGSGYVLVTGESAHILTDFRYYQEIAARAAGYEMHLLNGDNPLLVVLNQLIAREGIATLGFEGDKVSWQTGCAWRDGLNVRLSACSLDPLRIVKTEEELARLRKACAIADATARHICAWIRPGQTEREVAAELEWFMKQQGADNPSFDTLVLSGPRGSLPHGKPSDKIIAAGELITLDFGARCQGYCSDMTRTFLVAGGDASPENHPLYAVYQTVLAAQLAAIAAIRPGVTCSEVDRAARDIITRAGYGAHFGHNTGHAIGIDVHEEPRFSPGDTTVLQPNMVLTVEPGIYLEGLGGVRIEDMVLVTPEGGEVLYTMPKTLLLTGEKSWI